MHVKIVFDEIQEVEDDEEEGEPSELDVLSSSLTGIGKGGLIDGVDTYRNVQGRSRVFKVPFTVEKANESTSTDAFAKGNIYAKTFLWLVRPDDYNERNVCRKIITRARAVLDSCRYVIVKERAEAYDIRHCH